MIYIPLPNRRLTPNWVQLRAYLLLSQLSLNTFAERFISFWILDIYSPKRWHPFPELYSNRNYIKNIKQNIVLIKSLTLAILLVITTESILNPKIFEVFLQFLETFENFSHSYPIKYIKEMILVYVLILKICRKCLKCWKQISSQLWIAIIKYNVTKKGNYLIIISLFKASW